MRTRRIPRSLDRPTIDVPISAIAGNEIIAWNKRGNNFMPPRRHRARVAAPSCTIACLSHEGCCATIYFPLRYMRYIARTVVQLALDEIGITRWHNARDTTSQLRARGPCIIIVIVVVVVVFFFCFFFFIFFFFFFFFYFFFFPFFLLLLFFIFFFFDFLFSFSCSSSLTSILLLIFWTFSSSSAASCSSCFSSSSFLVPVHSQNATVTRCKRRLADVRGTSQRLFASSPPVN